MTHEPRLVLFDIDGTLIKTGRAGVRGMNAAFQRLHGRVDAMERVSFAGRTDRAIVTDIFQVLGIDPEPHVFDALRDAYFAHLEEEIRKPVEGVCVLPGVGESLATLEAREDVEIGLLTGNFQRGAAIKLGHFDLWRRFAFGAFGDDHADRRALVPIALAEARRALGLDVPPTRVIVIGDTPLDVDCAHAHGAIAVAVATGPFTAAQLRESQPDLVLETLEDVEALLSLVNSPA
jgi:phosphoglycolate phosphatase-like HAD superfamily hydrolase